MLFTRLQFTSKVALGVHSLQRLWTSMYSFAHHTQTQLISANFFSYFNVEISSSMFSSFFWLLF